MVTKSDSTSTLLRTTADIGENFESAMKILADEVPGFSVHLAPLHKIIEQVSTEAHNVGRLGKRQ